MSMFVAWVVFPLVALAVSGGVGLAIERLAGRPLPGVLVLPVGLAGVVAVAQLTTYKSATAPVTTPLVVVIAVLGLVFGRSRLRGLVPDRWAAAAAVGVFACFAAPVVLSGSATFAGYGVLGDTAIHFIGVDRLLGHGRTLSGLPPSSYQGALASYFNTGYPFGIDAGLGALRPLAGQDVAWVYQPFLALLASMTSLCLFALTRPLLAVSRDRAIAAFLAAQPALLFAFSLQGSIKELGTAWIVALLVALAVELGRRGEGFRAVLPLAIASAAGISVIGLAIAPWLAPILLVAVILVALGFPRSWQRLAWAAGVFAVLVVVLSIPTLGTLNTYTTSIQNLVTAPNELGNLLAPLDSLQAFGIWLTGDYRVAPTATRAALNSNSLTFLLIGVAIASGVLGLLWAARRRALAPVLFILVSVVACVYVVARGSPWADAKALMIVSPALVLAAVLGVAALRERGFRIEALLVLAALTGGVMVSNALAYHDASLAPRDRLADLDKAGKVAAGKGPTLYTEFEEYAKHFLRRSDPTGVTEAFSPAPAGVKTIADGAAPRFGFPTDLDTLSPAYTTSYRTIVVRRSPVASRPPAPFRLIWSGRWYQVWERIGAGDRVLTHVALGGPLAPGAVPRCSAVRAASRAAANAGAELVAAPSTPVGTFVPARAKHPGTWGADAGDPNTLVTVGPGSVTGAVTVPRSGRYDVWLGGSFGRADDVAIDGRRAGSVSDRLNGEGEYERVATVSLTAGRHSVRVSRGGGNLAPGSGDRNRRLGPLVVAPQRANRPLERVQPSDWRSLCGQTLDWIEVVRAG